MSKVPVCAKRAEMEDLLLRREDDSLSAVETGRLNGHLATCAGCRASALQSDPTLLFSRLSVSGEGRPDTRLVPEAQQVVADVLAAIDVDRTRRRLSSGSRRTFLRLAAGLVLATGLGGYWASKRDAVTSGPLATTESREPQPTLTNATANANAKARRAFAGAELLAAPAASRPLIEGVQSKDATIYQFAASAPGEPSVVFIVDKNADI